MLLFCMFLFFYSSPTTPHPHHAHRHLYGSIVLIIVHFSLMLSFRRQKNYYQNKSPFPQNPKTPLRQLYGFITAPITPSKFRAKKKIRKFFFFYSRNFISNFAPKFRAEIYLFRLWHTFRIELQRFCMSSANLELCSEKIWYACRISLVGHYFFFKVFFVSTLNLCFLVKTFFFLKHDSKKETVVWNCRFFCGHWGEAKFWGWRNCAWPATINCGPFFKGMGACWWWGREIGGDRSFNGPSVACLNETSSPRCPIKRSIRCQCLESADACRGCLDGGSFAAKRFIL